MAEAKGSTPPGGSTALKDQPLFTSVNRQPGMAPNKLRLERRTGEDRRASSVLAGPPIIKDQTPQTGNVLVDNIPLARALVGSMTQFSPDSSFVRGFNEALAFQTVLDKKETEGSISKRERLELAAMPQALFAESQRYDTKMSILQGGQFREQLEAGLKEGNVLASYVDLDGFKWVNDKLGHDMGDRVLINLARFMRIDLRPRAAGRMGGDEIMLLFNSNSVEEVEQNMQTIDLAAKWALELGRIQLNNQEHPDVSIGASAGVLSPLPGESASAYIQRLEKLMYDMKRRRKADRREQALAAGLPPPEER